MKSCDQCMAHSKCSIDVISWLNTEYLLKFRGHPGNPPLTYYRARSSYPQFGDPESFETADFFHVIILVGKPYVI